MKLRLIDSEKKLDESQNKESYTRKRNTKSTNHLRTTNEYTMKIVLTMTVQAPCREQAEVLANHVAAFMPEDAQRVADAFAPVIIVSRGNNVSSEVKTAAATASVILVTNAEAAEGLAELPNRSPHNSRSVRTSAGSGAIHPNNTSFGARRLSVYTKSSLS